MPCMGPSINENKVNEAYSEILLLLKTKYDLLNMNHHILKFSKEQRDEALRDLCKAVRGIFVQDACEGF